MLNESRAILVEGHPIIRNALVTTLLSTTMFEEVETANCFQELNEKLEKVSAYKLLILDMSFTDISGLMGVAIMRKQYPDIPILVFAANDSLDMIIQCFEHGVHGFVSKISSMQKFVNAIRVVLAGGVYIPSSAAHRMGVEPSESTEYQLEPSNERPQLTPKQREVFEQLLLGLPNKVIAIRLGMAEGTVKTHLHNIYQLLGVNSRAKAILNSQHLRNAYCLARTFPRSAHG